MPELFLLFEFNGDRQRVRVDKDEFVIGRHSAADLSIADGRLSREHLKINRYGDLFFAGDLGSSNGTTLNGENLIVPLALNSGDKLDLGGIEITAEIEANAVEEPVPESVAVLAADPEPAQTIPVQTTAPAATTGGIPKSFFIIAPVAAVCFIVFVIGAMYLFSSGNKTVVNSDNIYSADADDVDPKPKKKESSDEVSTDAAPERKPGNSITVASDAKNSPSMPKTSSESAKIEQNAAAFMRKIAQNDPTAFLTTDQAQAVAAKVKSLSVGALADNINSAKKNSAQIRELAVQKNLKPELLAAAAIAKLGSQRGDALTTARGMADVLDKLGVQIGNELSDDVLLMIAAYEQGKAGEYLRMRNMLQTLSNQFPQSSREIRTIWFLHKNGKITEAEFDFALRFLAVGTVSQNPKDFNVNAESLTF